MPYGQRIANMSGTSAEGDKFFAEFQYGGATGALTYGMPVFKALTDAAEFNARSSATALSPAVSQSGGTVVLATDATTTIYGFVGVYQPTNPADLPAKNDVIRVLAYGVGLVSAISETGNVNPLKVGDILVTKATTTSGSTAAQTPSVGASFAIVLATKTFITLGAQLLAAASNTAMIVNGFVTLL